MIPDQESRPTPESQRELAERELSLLCAQVNLAVANGCADSLAITTNLGTLRRLLHRNDRLEEMRTRHHRILEQVRRLNREVRSWKCEAELNRLMGKTHRKVYGRLFKIWTSTGPATRAQLTTLFGGKSPFSED